MITFLYNCPAEVDDGVLPFVISHLTNHCALAVDRFERCIFHKEKASLCHYRNHQVSLGSSKYPHNYTTPIRMRCLSLLVLRQIT